MNNEKINVTNLTYRCVRQFIVYYLESLSFGLADSRRLPNAPRS